MILERFRAGQYSKPGVGRVLNEGVDVPDCRVAIIVSRKQHQTRNISSAWDECYAPRLARRCSTNS